MEEEETLLTKQINERFEAIQDELPKEKEKDKTPWLPKLLLIILGISVLSSLLRILF